MEHGMNDRTCFFQYLPTAVGTLKIQADEQYLLKVEFVDHQQQEARANNVTKLAYSQLGEYLSGQRTGFTLPLGAKGTLFQQQVWDLLVKIPYGHTCSYQHIANQLSNPGAVRAVGAANGKNPLAIVVPCHRVIGANGSLTGYAGGLQRKSWLLELESLNIK
jgi:methylated-DNA-[protein]-cysteine S-methyltransferase